MPTKPPKQIGPPSGDFFASLAFRTRLFLRLMRDRRVNLFLKAIPFAGVIYLVFPFDIPTPIDDAVVLWVGVTVFMELCPPAVVAEHERALSLEISGASHESPREDFSEEKIIDGEFRDITEEDEQPKEHK